MNRSRLQRVFPQVMAWTALVVLCAAVAVAQDQNAAQNGSSAAAQAGERTDGQIEMDVVHALDASKALKTRPKSQ